MTGAAASNPFPQCPSFWEAGCPSIRSARIAIRGAPPPGPSAGPDPDGPLVDRVVGVPGTIQVAGQKVRVGRVHARTVVQVHIEETTLTVYDGQAGHRRRTPAQQHRREPVPGQASNPA